MLANDTDADSDELTVMLLDTPHHSSVEMKNDGSFTYTPTIAYADTFSYPGQQWPRPDLSGRGLDPGDIRARRGAAHHDPGRGPARTLRTLEAARGSSVDVYVLRAKGIVVFSGLKSVVLMLQRGDGQYWNGHVY